MVTAYGVLCGRVSLTSIPTYPQDPWEAQEEAHTSQGPEWGQSNFRFVVHLELNETRQKEVPQTRFIRRQI